MKPPAETVIDLYSRRARDFDNDRDKRLFERPWLDAFLAHIPEGGEVLDIGCGSGEPIARCLIGRGRRVTGIDASPALIDLCRRRFPDHKWLVGDLRRLDLGRAFDGVIAWHSLIHIEPAVQAQVIEFIARHLRPDGVLLFTSGSERGETVGRWRDEPLYHGSLPTAQYRAALEMSGFDVLRHVESDPACGGTTVWLAQRSGGKVPG